MPDGRTHFARPTSTSAESCGANVEFDQGHHIALGIPVALALAWAFNDPGRVHLRETGTQETLCGMKALTVDVSRRSVTCPDCQKAKVARG